MCSITRAYLDITPNFPERRGVLLEDLNSNNGTLWTAARCKRRRFQRRRRSNRRSALEASADRSRQSLRQHLQSSRLRLGVRHTARLITILLPARRSDGFRGRRARGRSVLPALFVLHEGDEQQDQDDREEHVAGAPT